MNTSELYQRASLLSDIQLFEHLISSKDQRDKISRSSRKIKIID